VHLTRRDKVAQAVSYVKAQQTGLWHAAPDGAELERLSPPQEPAYDASEIRTRLEEITAHDHSWEHWFAALEIDPLRITYEELFEGPVETLRVVLDHLGLEREAADGVEPGVAKLTDNINRDWVACFRSEQKSASARWSTVAMSAGLWRSGRESYAWRCPSAGQTAGIDPLCRPSRSVPLRAEPARKLP
jgi:LPS sulfotransferase NodH